MPNHAITALTLENFRNQRAFSLHVPARSVVISGPNGVGKTNILEALSLLVPGRGLRGAKLIEIDDMHQVLPFAVGAEVRLGEEARWIGTGRDGESARERRIAKIDGTKLGSLSALAQHVSMLWITPAFDTVFLGPMSGRRSLLDRLVETLHSHYAIALGAYQHAMRERRALLKTYDQPDAHWLDVLEETMAQQGVAMCSARADAVEKIMHAMVQMPNAFPKASLTLEDPYHTLLYSGMAAQEVEAKLKQDLRAARGRDQAAGRALLGPHRAQVNLRHESKNMLIEQCSTGEQKAALLSLVLATCLARAAWLGAPPILLLDEVIAHLDVDKQNCLFDLISKAAIQAWLTGTDASDFSSLRPHATSLTWHAGGWHVTP